MEKQKNTSYEKLAIDPLTKKKWKKLMAFESGNIGEDQKATNTPGIKTVILPDHDVSITCLQIKRPYVPVL